MFHDRIFKTLSSIVLVLTLSAGQIAASPNKGNGYGPARTAELSSLFSGVVNGYEANANTSNASAIVGTIARDIVLVFDTSGSMAYETVPGGPANAPGNDPSVCNLNNSCQPMKAVKDASLGFLDALNFPIDRVAVVTLTSQTSGGDRYPREILPLTSNKADVISAINGIKVFEPRDCDGTETPGACLAYYGAGGTFSGEICEIYEIRRNSSDLNVQASADPSSCPSSNIGGALGWARQAFTEDPAQTRLDAFWMVIPLLGGPANATDTDYNNPPNYPYGFCPPNTFLAPMQLPWCRDRHPTSRHADSDPLVTYINPITGVEDPHSPISLYDADDYARDMADGLATSISGEGVTIFTIGLGEAVKYTGSSDDYYPDGITKIPAAEYLLKYIAECAGENSPDDCATPVTNPQISHGQYFYAPTTSSLADIFQVIANYGSSYTGIYYVKSIASGTANCQSWENACTLQSALTTAISGDEIWVAAGLHKPTTGTDRAATFQLKTGVNTYGGFSGTETTRDQRDPIINFTLLSGDLNNDDAGFTNNSENVYHVVTGANDAILDGFTIAGGNANGDTFPDDSGGGILNLNSSPTLTNITFSGNSTKGGGGGMFNLNNSPILTDVTFHGNLAGAGGGIYNANSSPTLFNVIFDENSAEAGGGMFNVFGNPSLTNITFIGNLADMGGGLYEESTSSLDNVTFVDNSATSYGGGMVIYGGSPILTNVTFTGNSANSNGGGMLIYGSPILTNVTFTGNSANSNGGGIYNAGDYPTIRNAIFWDNTDLSGYQIYDNYGIATISDSVIQGACSIYSICTNIITTDPKLGTLGNYGGFTQTIPLLPGSSAINTGDDGTCPATDQRGIARPQGAHCDIGAYEYQDTTAPIVNSITRVDPSPANLASVDFTVTFSESVTGVDASDFTLTTNSMSGVTVSGVSGSSSIYTVTVNTGSGNGTIRLNVVDDNSIVDAASNPLGGTVLGDGDFISGEIYTIIKSATFADVPLSYWSSSSIERLYNAGITGGCTTVPLNYCPINPVTRAQMAIFLLRGMHGSAYTPPAATGTVFTDVPLGTFGAAWIEQLATEGITNGCGGGKYCPNQTVSRAQMAIFLVRAKHGVAFVPPTATGIFTDVPVGSFGADFIEQLVTDAITSGCGAGIYCPSTTVKRDSMAVFLVKTFNLP